MQRSLILFLAIGMLMSGCRPQPRVGDQVLWAAHRVPSGQVLLEATMMNGWMVHEAHAGCVAADTCITGATAVQNVAGERETLWGDTVYAKSAAWMISLPEQSESLSVRWAACTSGMCMPPIRRQVRIED